MAWLTWFRVTPKTLATSPAQRRPCSYAASSASATKAADSSAPAVITGTLYQTYCGSGPVNVLTKWRMKKCGLKILKHKDKRLVVNAVVLVQPRDIADCRCRPICMYELICLMIAGMDMSAEGVTRMGPAKSIR